LKRIFFYWEVQKFLLVAFRNSLRDPFKIFAIRLHSQFSLI
jgi:hypothetical protein